MKRGALIPSEGGGGILMALIIAAMAFLACFSLAGSLGASKLANAWTEGLSGAATVRIGAEDGIPEQQIGIVLDILKSTDGVIDAVPLTTDEVSALLEPWFGAAPELAEILRTSRTRRLCRLNSMGQQRAQSMMIMVSGAGARPRLRMLFGAWRLGLWPSVHWRLRRWSFLLFGLAFMPKRQTSQLCALPEPKTALSRAFIKSDISG